MEGSDWSGCSKTSVARQIQEEESGSGENDEEESKLKNGASSSNSTVEESGEKKPSVRTYVRSKMPRLRWTPELHLCFVKAVERLGGLERATPKLVLQLMNVNGLSIAHVKSHLQMYRSKKIDDQGHFISEHHRHLVNSGNRNIYNLSQIPMLQGYNQRHLASFRYGDATWNGRENFIYGARIGRCLIDETRPRLYGTLAQRIFGRKTSNWITNCNFQTGTSSFSTHKPGESVSSHSHKFWQDQPSSSHGDLNPLSHMLAKVGEACHSDRKIDLSGLKPTNNAQEWKNMKRKANDCDLDLDLSLKLTPRNDDRSLRPGLEDGEVDGDLSLSLYSSPSFSRINVQGNNNSKEQAKRASTLDLTT